MKPDCGQIWKNKKWHGTDLGYFFVMSCDKWEPEPVWRCAYAIHLDGGWGTDGSGWGIEFYESELPEFAEYVCSLEDFINEKDLGR